MDRVLWGGLMLLVACTGSAEKDDVGGDPAAGDTDSGEGGEVGSGSGSGTDTGDDGPAWGEGTRTVSGAAFFFDMPELPNIVQMYDVEGAEVYVWEAPELRATLHPEDDHAFAISGIPDGAQFSLAIEHPDFVPTLVGVLQADGDVEGVTFQHMSHQIGDLAAGFLGADLSDSTVCHMATTVSAAGADDVWAPGEPGATVTLDPSVPAEAGPWYFNTMVLPDMTLSETTTDGGVIVLGVEPGLYTWSGHKEGVDFVDLETPCVGGWLTNASPPYGLNVAP